MRLLPPAISALVVALIFSFSALSQTTAPAAPAPAPVPAATPAPYPKPAARPVPDFSMPPVADAALDARIRALILTIEDKPSGVIINNAGYIENAPANQPYNADGSRNENFRVTPDLSSANTAYLLNGEQRKQKAYEELVRIGRPAVPLLSMAVVMEGYDQRPLHVKALGEIRDPRAVPHLIKYMEDGKMMLSMAASMVSLGNTVEAKKLMGDGNQMMADAADALAKITGQNYGPNLGPWRQWWEENKSKIQGPMPPTQLYQVGTSGASPGPMPLQSVEVQVSPHPGAPAEPPASSGPK